MSDDKDRTSSASLVDESLDEHRGCMRLVAAVEACLDRPPSDPVAWLAALGKSLTELEGALDRHFRSEEAGPLFTELPVRHPRLAVPLARLKGEHPEMLERVRSAVAAARALDGPEVFQLRELNAQVQLAVAQIRRHEAAENELVMQAHWVEVGTGD